MFSPRPCRIVSDGDSTARRDMAETATVFRGVLLVIFLRPIEWSCEFYLRHNRAIVSFRFLELSNRVPCGGFLFRSREENRRAVVVPDIKSLTVGRGGIVNIEEKVEQP